MPVRIRGNSFQVDLAYQGQRWRPTFPTRDAAEGWELESRQRLRRGEEPILPKDGVAGLEDIDLLSLYEKTAARHWVGLPSEQTARTNAEDVLSVLGEETLAKEVNVSSVDRLIEHFRKNGKANGTINRKLAALSKMLRHAFDRGWINRMPTIARVKESEPRLRWLQPEEEVKVLDWFSDNHTEMNDLVTFLVDTGFRLSEGLGLKWSDVREGKAFIWGTESKSGRSRAVPLTARLRGMLASRRLADPVSNKVFTLGIDTVEWWWEKMRKKTGLDDDLVVHSLRHTFCTRLINKGVSLPVVQKLAGHANITTTMRYVHSGSADDLTAAIDRLSGIVESLLPVDENAGDTSVTNGVTVELQQTAA